MQSAIPFNRPSCVGNEQTYLIEALNHGHISGDGPFTAKCRELLETEFRESSVLLTTSCTHALEMAALLLDLKPGDEVIVPSFTFVSTVNAFVLRGAKPVFLDIRSDTKNLDETLLLKAITKNTRAIIPVHYAGVACEMDYIAAIAKSHNVAIVEDNAHGFFGKYKGHALGSFGAMSTLSFHETKNIQCGEGGALVLNDSSLFERAEIIREKGTNRSRFFRGQVDKYSWVDIGSSYLPSDLLAAYLLAQLEARDHIQDRRRQIWTTYRDGLSDWSRDNGVEMPYIPEHCDQSYHMFYLVLPDLMSRQGLISHLKAQNILSVFHYLPLHSSDMGLKFGYSKGDCPVTENISDRILRLPFYVSLSAEQQRLIIDTIQSFTISSRT